MAKKNQENTYKILLDGDWSLEDLTTFTRVYFQNYSFLYSLENEDTPDKIASVLKDYELRDGLSYVNIYDILKSHVPKEDRPAINSIRYSSPGWMELILNPHIALEVAGAISIFLKSMKAVGEAYKKLYKIYVDLNAERLENKNTALKLKKENIEIANKLNQELAKGLGFKNLAELDKHTGDVEESSKLLMAHYRRIEKMANFVKSGKAEFPLDNE